MQLISVLGAAGIVIVLSIIYDAVNRSMSWYSHPWIIFGIYLCPLAFVLGLGPALYITIRNRLAKKDETLKRTTRSYQIQMFLHAQCFLFSIFLLIFTALMLKTTFIFTFIVMFYFFAAFINLVFKFLHHGKDIYMFNELLLSQI